jgi:transcriptional antiterminator RfaH
MSNLVWLAAITQPNREEWAQENVERQGWEHYLPRFREWKFDPRIHRKRAFEQHLFPGYMFVLTDGTWRFLSGTFGCIGVVLTGEAPATVRHLVIDALKAQEDTDGFIVLPERKSIFKPKFQQGQRVRATEGPASGCFGIYQDSTRNHRARVLFDILGTKTPVWMDEEFLEPAKRRVA